MKKFTTAEITDLLNQVYREEISFSRMVEMINERVDEKNEPQYKDGDFVVSEAGNILIFRKKDEDRIYDHAYLTRNGTLLIRPEQPTSSGIKRHATEEEKQKLLDALAKKGKRWNAEKKCIEDIPKRKFKKGDKVRIKHGVSSKTHYNIYPWFVDEMDDLIGKTMTVDRYTDGGKYVACEETESIFREEWLEPYEELKEGDLAIFWDNVSRRYASVRIFGRLTVHGYCDITGVRWDNAIKFEGKEQFEKLIKGEI
jgi:hypothetical protein